MTEPFNFMGKSILILVVLMLSAQVSCIQANTGVDQRNRPPVIEKIKYDKTTYHNRPVKLECTATDADGDSLTYVWEAKDGKIAGEGKIVTWTPPGNMQDYPVTLTVTDGKGGEARETIYIRVVTNADGTDTPKIEVKLRIGDNNTVVIENQRVGIWTTAGIICVVDNVEKSKLRYKWSADCGKIQGTEGQNDSADRINWIAPGAQSKCTVDVTVSDIQNGGEARGKVILNVYCCGKELTGE